MNSTDLIGIIGNLSQSLYPIQHLITGGAYILGILFFILSITKLRKIAEKQSQEKMYGAMVYLLIGAVLLFLPSALSVVANTTFGSGNILTYDSYNKTNIYSSMGLLIQTTGVLWFVRGCVLVVHSSNPGTQHGSKGLAFIFAGILAMNFDNTIAMLNFIVSNMATMAIAFKTRQGY